MNDGDRVKPKNGIEMIQDVIRRNFAGSPVEVHEGSHDAGPVKVLHFDIGMFNNVALKNIFNYWKLDWRDWVVEWSVVRSETPGKKHGHVEVSLFVKAALADVVEGSVPAPGTGMTAMKTYTIEEANKKLYGSDTRVVYEYDARGVVMRLEELVGWELGCGDKWKTCSNLQTLICETECGSGAGHYVRGPAPKQGIRAGMELADYKPVCPRCNAIGATVDRISYIEIIYDVNECPRCNHRWRRVYHYIGVMDDFKGDIKKEYEELMEAIKNGGKKLDEKHKSAPAWFTDEPTAPNT